MATVRKTQLAYDDLGRENSTKFYDNIAGATYIESKTKYEFGPTGRKITTTDPDGNPTVSDSDSVGNVTRVTEPPPLNAPTGVTPHAAPVTKFAYDYAGVNGTATTTNTEKWSDGREITDTFNAPGELVNTKDKSGSQIWTQTYAYNDLGRLSKDTFESNNGTSVVYNTEATRTYTLTGVQNSLTYKLGGTQKFSQSASVDKLDRIYELSHTTSTTPTVTLTVSMTYQEDGRLRYLARKSSAVGSDLVATDFGYFSDGDLKSIVHSKGTVSPAPSINVFTYSYDDAHRLKTFQLLSEADQTSTFDYDAENQLKSASLTAENYTYDNNGNRTNPGYVTREHNLLVEDASYRYSYDLEGNRLRRTDKTTGQYGVYTWDHRNRLTAIELKDSGGTVQQWFSIASTAGHLMCYQKRRIFGAFCSREIHGS